MKHNWRRPFWVIPFFCFLLSPDLEAIASEWDFSNYTIPLSDIQSGGPPKDGIPALTEPKYMPGNRARFMHPSENVLGVQINGIARAYPTRILSWHELVNDRFGHLPVLVSW